MLDIRIIREDADSVKERVKNRGGDAHLLIDEILECDAIRREAETEKQKLQGERKSCLLYTSPSPRDQRGSRMPSSA